MIDYFKTLSGRANVYFLRHGESRGNSARIIQGRQDLSLSKQGLEQSLGFVGQMSAGVAQGDNEAQVAINQLLQSIRIGAYGSTATIDFSITKTQAEKISEIFQKLQNRARSPF